MRVLVIAVIAAIVGGGAVYGVLLYLGQNPVQVSVQLRQAAPSLVPALRPSPTVPRPPTATVLPTAAPPTVSPTATLLSTPTATAAPTPTPGMDGPTEREIVVSAFAACNGKYSGEAKRQRFAATNSAIDRDLHSVASIRALVEETCGGVFPHLAMAAQPTNTPQPTTAVLALPTLTPLPPVVMPTPVPTVGVSTVAQTPYLRHVEEKRYMLSLVNAERKKAGLGAVTLGDNIAAQLHAESALENCFSSHWGIDGLKPYMRYSLAGGYQSNGENWSGLDYCIKSSDGYSPNSGINQEIWDAMDGWMRSPGHRRNVLDPTHRKVSIGIAWNRYNTVMLQHFEGDYVEYDRLPAISNGVLTFAMTTKNGARISENLGQMIFYDPPPHELTRGQVARTYCYDNGRPVASLREPLTGGYFRPNDTFTTTYKPCPSPYDVPARAPAPRSPGEAHQAWQQAYSASQSRPTQSIIVPRIIASQWTASGKVFALKVNISDVLNRHGDGVYSLMLWGKLGGEDIVISQYSIFHGVTPPGTYSPAD